MTWQPGTRLNQYKIERVLGSGGFGITYKATHLTLNQRVVIKTINDTLHGDPEYQGYVERFRKEAQILAKLGELRHPHIVRVSDLFEAPLQEMGLLQRFWQGLWGIPVPQLPCLVMDFIEGENLFERVRKAGSPLEEREALKCIQQAGDALALVHRAGLVHRDAHPGNIMICNGNAILIDFGLAGSVIPTVMSSKIGGNPAFAPPDQWRGNRKPNVDIYTLAMSLYFALTADTPDPLTEPKAKNPKMSDRSNVAIRKAIDLNPDNRPQSIAEWFKTLGLTLSTNALQQLPDLSQPVSKGKTAPTRKISGVATPPIPPTVDSPPSRSLPRRVFILAGIIALAVLVGNWRRGGEPTNNGTQPAQEVINNTIEAPQDPKEPQNPTVPPSSVPVLPSTSSNLTNTITHPTPTNNNTSLTEEDALKLIKAWLEVKSTAMGQNHNLIPLEKVLTGEALIRRKQEAEVAKSEGFYVEYVHKLSLESLELLESDSNPTKAIAIVLLDEFATFYQNGTLDAVSSYNASGLNIRYDLHKVNGEWRIADMNSF